MKITVVIPCHNEEKSIRTCVESCLSQTRPFDQVLVINDGSTDKSGEILKEFGDRIDVLTIPNATGNKSRAQEKGVPYIKGDVFVATDGDTILDKDFAKHIETDFVKNPNIVAVGGYVRSLKHNWLTACRALDYAVGQNIDKLAQDSVGYMMVIPGAAGAFRTDIFKSLTFDHDTLTEDLDFTFKLHKLGYKIKYNREAICYTQDPGDFKSYVNQMRRWFGGGWQNFNKHITIPQKPGMALELALMYGEGLIFSVILFALPLINIVLTIQSLAIYFVAMLALTIYGSYKEKRWDFIKIIPHYMFLKYVNAYIYLEQFVKEVIFRKRNLIWFKPVRVQM